MKQFRGTVIGDRYPMDFSCQATDWPAAAQRITQQWRKHRTGKGTRATAITIKIVAVG